MRLYHMKTRLLYTLLFLCSAILFSSLVYQKDTITEPFVVVLDAGHGGKDPGNMGNGYFEKDIVLDVTLQVGRILEQEPGFKVVYTRKTDVFIELDERAPVANKIDADIFVSIHCDSHASQAFGAGTFVMGLSKSKNNLNTAKKENEVIFLEENYEEKYAGFDPNSPESLIGLTLMQEEYLNQSIILAGLIQNNMVNNLKRKDRSVKQDVFWVLHHSYMPSVLIELGFLTNNKEGPYINSNKGRREMAKEVANGIITYRKNIALATSNGQNRITSEQETEVTRESRYQGVDFRVQLAASSKKLETKSYNFNGLSEISREQVGKLFKYYYGSTSDYSRILEMKNFAKQNGYPSCYVVAFKNGDKIKLSDVLKSEDK